MLESSQRKPFSQILSDSEVTLFNPGDFASLTALIGSGGVGGESHGWWSRGRRG
jgi:hypothetical protein